jgi:hypothetical protein
VGRLPRWLAKRQRGDALGHLGPQRLDGAAFLDHERAKSELKASMPEDAREALGHGVRAKRSKSGAVSFDLLSFGEGDHAAVQ